MRNKVSNSLFKRGLISFAAAGLLATSSYAVSTVYEGSVQDFRITMDKTTVEKSTGTVNVVVELLDENGKLDILTTDTAQLIVNSVLGNIIDANTSSSSDGDLGRFGDTSSTANTVGIDFTKGKAGFSIYYPDTAKIGTDTVRFTLKLKDNDDATYTKTLPAIDKGITVTNPSNQALGLEIQALQTSSGKGNKSDYSTNHGNANITSTSGTVTAGEAFTVKIQALKTADINRTADATTIFQNSTVTLNFLTSSTDKTKIYKSVEGTMTEGVAFVDIPADFLTDVNTSVTPSGYYYMYATTPTTKSDGTSTWDYLAKSRLSNDTNYSLALKSTTPSALKAVLDTTYNAMESNSSGAAKDAVVKLNLVDKYGNTVDSSVVTTSYTASIAIDSKLSQLKDDNATTATSTITTTTTPLSVKFNSTLGNMPKTLIDLNVSSKNTTDLGSPTSGVVTSTLSISSSDLTVLTPTLDIPIYTTSLDFNVTHQAATTKPNSFDANASGVLMGSNKDINVTDFNATLTAGTLYDKFIGIFSADTSKKVTVQVLKADDNKTVLAESSAYPSADGNVSIRFTTAVKNAEAGATKIIVENKPDYITQYGLGEARLIQEINATVPASIGLFKVANKDVTSQYGKLEKVTSISLDKYKDSNITLETNTNLLNSTISANTSDNNQTYFLVLTDIYGNIIDGGTSGSGIIKVLTDSGNLTPEVNSTTGTTVDLNVVNNENGYVNYGNGNAGTDNLILRSTVPGVNEVTIPVTVVDTTPKLGSVQIIAGSDYLLTNGEMAITIKALSETGTAYNMSNNVLTAVFSDPNLITLRDGNRSNNGYEYANGAFINCAISNCTDSNSTVAFSLTGSNTVGDVTLTVRNVTGSVTAEKTIHIVDSTAFIEALVDSITAVPATTEIAKGESSDVTFTVFDMSGNALADKTVQIKSDNSAIVTLDTTETTDENGEVTVNLTAKAMGTVNITATSEGKSTNVVVDVTAAAAMTIDKSTVSVMEGLQETITITNPAKTLTDSDITNSNSEIAVASLVDGDVVITAKAEGSTTITINDGTTTKTVEVSVEKGAEPATTPAIITGWNLLGNASNDTVEASDFAVLGESVWTYGTEAGWVEFASIAPMQGFWYKSKSDKDGLEFPMSGDGTGEVEFTAGEWTLMTTSEATTLGEIKTAKGASEGWVYMGTSWSNADTEDVEAGRGFWIK